MFAITLALKRWKSIISLVNTMLSYFVVLLNVNCRFFVTFKPSVFIFFLSTFIMMLSVFFFRFILLGFVEILKSF